MDVARAEAFVASLLGDMENIENSNGMRVLNNVNDIRTGAYSSIILRKITELFWRECIKSTKAGHRVCAVGSSGIGKSCTFPILIRILLLEGKTVVYLKRTKIEGRKLVLRVHPKC